jgi:hypothetical protein
MSVDVDVFLVDWEDFNAKIVRDGELAVLEGLSPEPLTWTSWKAAGEFVWIFEAMERGWRSTSKQAFAKILDTLFWSWRMKTVPVMELGIDPSDLNGIETAISPARVKDLAVLAAGVDLGECEGLYAGAASKAKARRFETFASYRGYAEEWFGMIRRASETGKGIVLVAFA